MYTLRYNRWGYVHPGMGEVGIVHPGMGEVGIVHLVYTTRVVHLWVYPTYYALPGTLCAYTSLLMVPVLHQCVSGCGTTKPWALT